MKWLNVLLVASAVLVIEAAILGIKHGYYFLSATMICCAFLLLRDVE